jgi:hypothetical protein
MMPTNILYKSCALGCALLLSSCARHVETRTESAGISPLNPATFVLVTPEKIVSPDIIRAQEIVTSQLITKGYTISQNGALYLQVGASVRPAALTVSDARKVIAQADKKRSISRCVRNEYRISIILTDIASGREVYRGSAGEFHCKESFAGTLPVLVRAALADLGNPRGTYITKRKLN